MDPASSGPWIALVVFFAVLVAFGAFAEAALSGINRARIQRMLEEGVPRARALSEALDCPNRYALTLLMLTTLALVGYTVASVWLVLTLPAYQPIWQILAGIGLLFLLGLVQVVARALAVLNAESSFMWALGPLSLLNWLFRPFTATVSAVAQLGLRLVGADAAKPAPSVTEEDLRLLVSVGQEEGVIEEGERQMIHGVMELEETTARELMVPRIDIAAVPADATVADVADVAVQRGFSRIPVYENSIDEIVGIAYAKDVLKYLRDGLDSTPVRGIVRPAHFIPESKRVNDLLHELQQSRVHMTIVVDEYGGTAGLVTIEDLLEEIVGEIQDEYDVEDVKIEKVSDTCAIFASNVSIEDVNDTLDLNLKGEDFDTIGGLVYDQLGKIPAAGDTVRLDNLLITVVAVTGRRIRQVRVEKLEPAPAEGAAGVAANGATAAPEAELREREASSGDGRQSDQPTTNRS